MQPKYLDELHQIDPVTGEPTHYAMVDPISGQPLMMPAELHNSVFGNTGGAPAGIGAPPPPPSVADELPAPATSFAAPTPTSVFPPIPKYNAPPAPAAEAGIPAPDFARTWAPGVNAMAQEAVPQKPIYGTTTVNDTTTHTVDPKAAKLLAEDRKAELESNTALNNALTAQGLVKQKQHELEYEELGRQQADQQARHAQYENELANKMAVANKTVDEFSNAKIDAGRYWANASTGEKVVSGIAMTLGAIGQALTGSRTNTVLDIIDDKVKQDIQIQKDNIDNKGRTAAMQKGLVAEYMAQGRDKEEAAQMAYLTSMRAIEKQYQSIGATSDNDILKAQAAQNAAQIRNKYDDALAKMTVTERTKKQTTSPISVGAGQIKEHAMPTPVFLQHSTVKSSLQKIDEAIKNLDASNKDSPMGGSGRLKNTLQDAREVFGEGDPAFASLKSNLTGLATDYLILEGRKPSKDLVQETVKNVIGPPTLSEKALRNRLKTYKETLVRKRNDLENDAKTQGWRSDNIPAAQHSVADDLTPEE